MTVDEDHIQIGLCGDVMLGRGIDQVLPHPGDSDLFEPYVTSALDYVALAERANGPIRKPVSFDYVWGDALEELGRRRPHLFIVNLETAVVRAGKPEPKGINYRMSPDNLPCLTAAGIDCCVLANNHLLDWGPAGLAETLDCLGQAGFATTGAGLSDETAAAPAVLTRDGARVLVFALAMASSGVPAHWAAGPNRPGVNFLAAPSDKAVEEIADRIRRAKRPGDIAVLSMHWGPNWGHEIPARDRDFAHALIDRACVDVVFGHSSHHPKAIEVHAGQPILFGCGDFLNDYEGIEGHEAYRGDLALLYLVTLDKQNGRLRRLEMLPFRIRLFRLIQADQADAEWLRQTMDRACRRFGGRVELRSDGALALSWHQDGDLSL